MTHNNAYVHTNNSSHHHHSFSIYAITNTRHICSHRHYHNQSTYMYSPTILQPNNIYVFTNDITINQHICIHQQYHNQSSYMYSPTTSQSINNIILFLTIQINEKILHTKIIIIFNTYQSFTYHHIIISNYPQKICQVFCLKDHFRQSSSLILQR